MKNYWFEEAIKKKNVLYPKTGADRINLPINHDDF